MTNLRSRAQIAFEIWPQLTKSERQKKWDELLDEEQKELAEYLLAEEQSKNPLRAEVLAAERLYDLYVAIKFIMDYADEKELAKSIDNLTELKDQFNKEYKEVFNTYYKEISKPKVADAQLKKLAKNRKNLEENANEIIKMLPDVIALNPKIYKDPFEFKWLSEKYKIDNLTVSKEKILHVATVLHDKQPQKIAVYKPSKTLEKNDIAPTSSNYDTELARLRNDIIDPFVQNKSDFKRMLNNLKIKAFSEIEKIVSEPKKFKPTEVIHKITEITDNIINEYTTNINSLIAMDQQIRKYDVVIQAYQGNLDKSSYQNLRKEITDINSLAAAIYKHFPSLDLDDIDSFNRIHRENFATLENNFYTFTNKINSSPYIPIIKNLVRERNTGKVSVEVLELRNRIRSAVEKYFDETLTADNVSKADRAASDRRIKDMTNILLALKKDNIVDIKTGIEHVFNNMEVGFFGKNRFFGSKLHRYVNRELEQFMKEQDEILKREFRVKPR